MATSAYKNDRILDTKLIPEPILDSDPGLIDFYWTAWKTAWKHVAWRKGIPCSPYMDEGFDPERIWIWDTCFMVHFCKYSPEQFPGIGSFDNFYEPMHDNVPSTLKIQHPDNPPLFAWTEYEYFKFTGDDCRLRRIIREKRYLQRHFEFLENAVPGIIPAYAICPIAAQRTRHGYCWAGCPNGMDNTPRGGSARLAKNSDEHADILWLDLLAQQGLAALYIARLARVIQANDVADEFEAHYREKKELLNRYYWNETDQIYYDVRAERPEEQVKVQTPASWWPLLAEMCDNHQAKALCRHAVNPATFGGDIPFPSVARNDKSFVNEGMYWRGGIWVPAAYMMTKALTNHNFMAEADALAEKLIRHMYRTWKEYEPHTIWECYSPTGPKPATAKDNKEIVRPDFCGWSALGPIAMLIENVLGFHDVDALTRTIRWRKHRKGRHGIKRLRFGGIVTDIVADAGEIRVKSNADYTLEINGEGFAIKTGETVIKRNP